MKSAFIAAAAALFLFSSCKKDSAPEIQTGDTGSVEIEFDNVVGEDDLELGTGTYTNGSDEAYTVTALSYYISNLKLKTADGQEYVVPTDESYFLIRENDESTHVIELEDVPSGDYTSFTFTVGIDAEKAGAPLSERTGVLDPSGLALDMYKATSEKYVFLKMEGTSPASTETDQKFSWEVGDEPKAVTVTAPFESSAKVRKDKEHAPEVHLFADVAKIFDGSQAISITENSIVDFSGAAASIATNYSGMFSIDHIHND